MKSVYGYTMSGSVVKRISDQSFIMTFTELDNAEAFARQYKKRHDAHDLTYFDARKDADRHIESALGGDMDRTIEQANALARLWSDTYPEVARLWRDAHNELEHGHMFYGWRFEGCMPRYTPISEWLRVGTQYDHVEPAPTPKPTHDFYGRKFSALDSLYDGLVRRLSNKIVPRTVGKSPALACGYPSWKTDDAALVAKLREVSGVERDNWLDLLWDNEVRRVHLRGMSDEDKRIARCVLRGC